MSYNGSGVFDPPAAPEYPAVAGDIIYAAYFNTVMQEVFDGLSNCITKDGQSVVGADINWGNHKLLNVSRVVVGSLSDNGNALQVTGNSTLTGELTFAGNSRRIIGDFSNTTLSNRLMFLTSTSNSSSGVGVMANGSGDGGFWNAYSGSDANNASVLQVLATSTQTALNSTVTGTGTQRALNVNIAGVTKLSISATEITPSVPIADVTFTGTIALPSTTSIGTVSSTEISYLDGVTSSVQTQLNAKEATITAGTTAQYWRGDKSWQTLNSTAVGLGNVDNTSDATKNAASVTLTNKTISGSSNTLTNIAQSSVTSLTTDLGLKAPLASPTFTGTVVLPSATSIGSVDATELGHLNGVTSAIQTQLDAKAALASPTFTGTPTVPTAAPGTNTTQAASTAFVTAAVVGAVSSGTFTPVVTGASSAGVGTYGYQEGRWSRLGDCVTFSLYVYWTTHTGTGQVRVSLPFTSANSALPVSCSINLFGGALLTSDMIPKTLISPNSAYVGLAKIVPSTGSDAALNMASNGAFVISGSYYV